MVINCHWECTQKSFKLKFIVWYKSISWFNWDSYKTLLLISLGMSKIDASNKLNFDIWQSIKMCHKISSPRSLI